MNKIEAIRILEDYLYDVYTADPLIKGEFVVNRPSVDDCKMFWCMLSSDIKSMFKVNYFPRLGGYYYLIDKKKGEIYTSPGNIEIDWTKDFYQFLSNEPHLINWQKAKVKADYLTSITENVSYTTLKKYDYKLAVNDWEDTILAKVEKLVSEISNDEINVVKIKYHPIDGIVCRCTIELSRKFQSTAGTENLRLLSRKFSGKLSKYVDEMTSAKKWIRVNDMKLIDNYWIELDIDKLIERGKSHQYSFKIEYQK